MSKLASLVKIFTEPIEDVPNQIENGMSLWRLSDPIYQSAYDSSGNEISEPCWFVSICYTLFPYGPKTLAHPHYGPNGEVHSSVHVAETETTDPKQAAQEIFDRLGYRIHEKSVFNTVFDPGADVGIS